MPMHVGRPAAVQEAGGRRAQLPARDVRVDARRRGGRAAVPQAPAPLGAHRRPAGLEARRAVRHRAPRAAQRAAQARAGSASCSSCARACTAPGWPGSGRCGRPTSSRACATAGSRCTPRPTTPWSTASRRCGCWPARCQHRPRPARHAAAVGRQPTPAHDEPADDGERRAVRGAAVRAARRAGHHRRGRRACRRRWSRRSARACKNETSALSLYAPRTIFNQDITGSRRFAAQDWPIERLRGDRQGHRHHHQRRRDGDVLRRDAHLPARARRAARRPAGGDGAGRPQRQAVADRLRRGRQRRRRGDGAAGHRPGRPGRAASARSTSR